MRMVALTVRQVLENYDYPGNIRELKNLIERLLVLSNRGEIRPEYLPRDMMEPRQSAAGKTLQTDYTESLREYRSKAERSYIMELLERYPDDLNQVAEILSITRRQLFNKMVEYGLK